jgi:dTMP kinase
VFITLEGGEGAGKSTLLRSLQEFLLQRGHEVIATREPGGTPLAEEVRALLLTHKHGAPLSLRAEMLLFLAARAQHIQEVIAPALDAGKVVICDRFNDSTIAYQGAARGLGVEMVSEMCRFACGGIEPGITIYLDIPPEIGLERARRGRGVGLDRIEREGIAFHEKVREGFLRIASREPDRFFTFDARKSAETIFEEVVLLLTKGKYAL